MLQRFMTSHVWQATLPAISRADLSLPRPQKPYRFAAFKDIEEEAQGLAARSI